MNGELAGPARSGSLRGILWGGILCGVFDITYAFIAFGMRGATPVAILHSIASGLLGKAAAEGGLATAALGLFLHFVIAFGAATVYYLASRKLPFLVRHAVVCGLLYGMAVYLFMNFVVIPLSAFPRKLSYPPHVLIPGIAWHMVLVGLPIALAIRWADTRARATV